MRTEDAGLVARCLAWEPRAWDAFVAAHGAFLRAESRRQLFRYLGRAGETDLDDACQEVYALLMRDGARALRQFRGESSISTWLACVVRSVCRRLAEAKESGVPAPEELAAPTPSEEDLPPDGLSAALSRLPSRDQRLLRLFFHDGRKYREIARELGVSINSVGPLLARALAAVRRLLPR